MKLAPWRNKSKEGQLPLERIPNPFALMHSELDRIFGRWLREPFGLLSDWSDGGDWTPALDIAETENEITVRAEVPGVEPKDLNVTVSDNILTIEGRKQESSERRTDGYYHAECRYGEFHRSVQLPAEVDTEAVSAEHANGVLTVRLKKTRPAKVRRVTVTSSHK